MRTLETFRRSLEAFDRRDKASWLDARDEEYEIVTSNEWPEGDVRGRDAAWDFYVTVADTFETARGRLRGSGPAAPGRGDLGPLGVGFPRFPLGE